VCLALAVSACEQPVSPLRTPSPSVDVAPPPVTPAQPPIVPGVVAPGGTYEFIDTGRKVMNYTRGSRFVLGDDGRFELQYEGLGQYRGTYTYSQDANSLTFSWEGWSVAGPWGASGTIKDDVLAVSFNIIMQLSDFEDASYRRVPAR
jgi:hypothetical protein